MKIENSRVVILDDIPDEIENLAKNFKKRGIGYVHYTGELSELPEKPLTGVRFIFVDFKLGIGADTLQSRIKNVTNILNKIISPVNGPYVVVLWTKHIDEINLFKEMMLKSNDIAKPFAIVDMEKSECMEKFDDVSRKIDTMLSNTNIITNFLLLWENLGIFALRDALNSFYNIENRSIQTPAAQSFDDYLKKLDKSIGRHLFRIATASLGDSNIKNDRNLTDAILLSLTAVFNDRMENKIPNEDYDYKKIGQEILANNNPGYTPEERAKMNSIFLIDKNIGKNLNPGCVYRLADVRKKIRCVTNCSFKKTITTPLKAASEFFNGDLGASPDKNDIIKKIIPVLVEITPECDSAQNKWKNSKLLLGVLWPEEYKQRIGGETGYIYKTLPFFINNKIFYLTFNSHFVYTFPLKMFEELKPFLKIRKEFLVDIQHWYANQISRPGKIEF